MIVTQQELSQDVMSELNILAPVETTQTKRVLSLQNPEHIQMNKKRSDQ